MTTSAGKVKENVWDYPRPPALEKTPRHLRVVWNQGKEDEVVLADTKDAYRVLETSHPPTYYFPPSAVRTDLLEKTSRSSYCEWKGQAAYFSFKPNSANSPDEIVTNRIWTYPNPTKGTKFSPIANYFSFYASAGKGVKGEWTCFVDDEKVIPQDGDFYGGWKTSDIEGKMKGGPGTLGW